MLDQQQVFSFAGRECVAGLFWQTVANARDWKKEARAQAEIQFKDMDLVAFCQLKDPFGVPQIGFAATSSGAKAGGIAMAPAIAKAIAERFNYSSWLGVFALSEDLYIFVAVVKDALLPEGDAAGNKAEVLERFGQEFGQTSQWEAIFAPKSFEIGNSQELQLDDLSGIQGRSLKLKSPSRLEPIKGTTISKRGVALLLASVVSIAVAYLSITNQLPFFQSVEPVVQEVAKVVDIPKPPERIVLPFPWKTQPEHAQVALMCLEVIQTMPVSPGGWNMDAVECGQTGVKFSWNRGTSNVRFILDAIPDVSFEGAGGTAMPNGDRASYTLSRQLPPPYEDEAVSNMREARLALLSLVQSIGLQGTFTDVPESETKNAKGQIEVKTWKNLTFALTGRLAPWDFVALVSHIHGLRLTRATLTGDQWKLEGDIYGK